MLRPPCVPTQGQKTLEACRNGKNSMLLFNVLITSCFWLLFTSIAMHLVATGTTFAFPLLLQHITAYLTTCDVRPKPFLSLCASIG